MTNVEAVESIRSYIEQNKSPILYDVARASRSGSNQDIARSVRKKEKVDTDVHGIGVISGIIACSAVIRIPDNELLEGQEEEIMELQVGLDWNAPPSKFSAGGRHSSRAIYRLSPSDPALIDAFHGPAAETEGLSIWIENEIDCIDYAFEQVKPETIPMRRKNSSKIMMDRKTPEELLQNYHSAVVIAAQAQHPHLAILSTQDSGVISDAEIPALASWLVQPSHHREAANPQPIPLKFRANR